MVFNLRAKLDGAGHYDDFEVDRVVAVELDLNAKQSELVGALEDRLGIPVLTANQVTMWSALTIAGRHAVGPGQRLLD